MFDAWSALTPGEQNLLVDDEQLRSYIRMLKGVADAERVAAQLAAGDAATWEDRGFSYPMALSLSRYLEARSGFHRVVDLLGELGRGASRDEALQRVYGVDYAAIWRGWKESVFEGLEE